MCVRNNEGVRQRSESSASNPSASDTKPSYAGHMRSTGDRQAVRAKWVNGMTTRKTSSNVEGDDERDQRTH